MSNAKLERMEVPSPGLISLTGAMVMDSRDVTEEDYIGHNMRRDGGLFIILELTTGEQVEVFCPFLSPGPDPTGYSEGKAPAPATMELHIMVTDLIYARQLLVADAKGVLRHFNVARVRDLTHEQAVEGMAMVAEMVEAAAQIARLKQAVLRLDPADASLWVKTGGHKGAPKVKAVEVSYYGEVVLTRRDIEATMPGYDRDSALEDWDNAA